ncbi:MAG: nucleotide exchange factor GrpE [Deltaproteobacteria bacterium]|jgi:molecular chaperone DnaK|nr:nucleotide exchange factor GrpE [Deltaproteobacteria bacterium]
MVELQRLNSVGIDLGTSFSRVAFMDGKTPRLLSFPGGKSQLPTTASFYQDRERVGREALKEAFNNPKGTIDCVKRLLAREYPGEIIRRESQLRSYSIVGDDYGYGALELGSIVLSPQDVLSLIISALKFHAERDLSRDVDLAVLSVPGCFDFQQRAAVMEALAPRFKVSRLITDHAAVCLSYQMEHRDFFDKLRRVLVLDVGGGFTKAALLEMQEGVIETKKISGSGKEAGEDIDRRLVAFLKQEFYGETGVELKRDKELIRLRDAASSVKSVLTTSLEAQIVLPDLLGDRIGSRSFQRQLSRHRFEELTEDILRGILTHAYNVVEGTGLGPDDLDLILFAGKAVSIPAIRRGMTRLFTREPVILPDSEAYVAKGNAIFASEAATGNFSTLLLDCLPVSLGIDTGADRINIILEKNSTYPVAKKSYYTTATDNQSEMFLRLVEGDGPTAASYRFMGNYKLSGVPPAQRGQTRVEVSYQIQGDGLFEIKAKELVSGKDLTVTLDEGALAPLSKDLSISVRNLVDRLEKEGGARKEKTPSKLSSPIQKYQMGEVAENNIAKSPSNMQGEENTVELIKNLIPVLDNLNLALSYADPKDQAVKSLADGVGMTLKGFLDTLGKYGLREIKASPGESFDPNFQEAMGFEPAPQEGINDGTVARMVHSGYLYNSMLLRPIQVTLAKRN